MPADDEAGMDLISHWADLVPALALAFLQGDHDATAVIIESMHEAADPDHEAPTLTVASGFTHLLAAAVSEAGGDPESWLRNFMDGQDQAN